MNLKLYWENIIGYFEEEDWPLYHVNEEKRTAITYIKAENATYRVFIWLYEQSMTLNLAWYLPSTVPPNRRHLINDLLNRVNHQVFMGKFIMDPEDGVLSFRISVNVTGTRFSMAQFDSFVNSGVWTTDEYYPKFMYLIYGDRTVDEVLEEEPRPRLRLVQKAEEQAELFEEDEACT